MASEERVSAVGLVLHPTKSVDESVDTIVKSTDGRPLRVLAREIDRHRVPAAVEIVSDTQFLAGLDGVIALGGDGTMLAAMRLVIDRPVPVLGVNHGNLGFLVEISPAQLPSALAQLAADDFTIEPYGCLEVDTDGSALTNRFGFNDVVLGRSSRAGAVSIDLEVNGLRYGYYRADAVVVSTPTGSTAYNYAAGGPVLSPSSGAFVITAVAPMSGISRPVVLGAQDRICLIPARDSAPIDVDIDGIPAGGLRHADRLTALMRSEAAQVVRLSAMEHAHRSRVKLSLLDLPLRRDQLLELIPMELRRSAKEALGRSVGPERPDHRA